MVSGAGISEDSATALLRPGGGTPPGASIPRGWLVSAGGPALGNGPIMTVDVEVGASISDISVGRHPDGNLFAGVQVLVRLHGHPIGIVLIPQSDVDPRSGVIDRRLLARRIWVELGGELAAHLRDDGLAAPAGLTSIGLRQVESTPCSWQARLGTSRPTATVCIATCGRSIPLLMRTVRSALDQTYDNTAVLVVDNRPGSSALPGALYDAFPDEDRLSYVTESRPGLAAARNKSLAHAESDIVALTDEDVVLDPNWLGYLVAGFDRPEVACVTGLILASRLETRAHILIEEYGGFSKGFERRRWDLDRHRLDHPVYPYLFGMYGSGANAAWRRPILQELGGYDFHLGAGTLTRAGEDLDAYVTCVCAGHQLVYEPAAIVRHEHRRDVNLLRDQVFGYGVALGAMITKRLLRRDERSQLVARLPSGVRYLLSPRSPKNAGKSARYPKRLTLVELAGIAYGPIAYLRSRRCG